MGRYRPPPEPKSPYITRVGYQALQDEARALWVKRRSVVQHLSAAAAEGDRSENAEYIYRKKQLRELDRRIRYLQKRLPELKVVDRRPDDPQRVFFGAWVTLERGDGASLRYRIVGADEFDPKTNCISVDSPMARALVRRGVGEEFELDLGGRVSRYAIVEVEYAPGSD